MLFSGIWLLQGSSRQESSRVGYLRDCSQVVARSGGVAPFIFGGLIVLLAISIPNGFSWGLDQPLNEHRNGHRHGHGARNMIGMASDDCGFGIRHLGPQQRIRLACA